ncbi:MAG: hypothetical protein WC423_01465 [Vulcanimicrobiota bacterium]
MRYGIIHRPPDDQASKDLLTINEWNNLMSARWPPGDKFRPTAKDLLDKQGEAHEAASRLLQFCTRLELEFLPTISSAPQGAQASGTAAEKTPGDPTPLDIVGGLHKRTTWTEFMQADLRAISEGLEAARECWLWQYPNGPEQTGNTRATEEERQDWHVIQAWYASLLSNWPPKGHPQRPGPYSPTSPKLLELQEEARASASRLADTCKRLVDQNGRYLSG